MAGEKVKNRWEKRPIYPTQRHYRFRKPSRRRLGGTERGG